MLKKLTFDVAGHEIILTDLQARQLYRDLQPMYENREFSWDGEKPEDVNLDRPSPPKLDGPSPPKVVTSSLMGAKPDIYTDKSDI